MNEDEIYSRRVPQTPSGHRYPKVSVAFLIWYTGFPPALIHRRREEEGFTACFTPVIHPDVDFAGTRGCLANGGGARARAHTLDIRRYIHIYARMRIRASNFSFYAPGYVLGRRSISHIARDDKTLRAKWPVHLGPAKPAIHSEPSRAEPRVARARRTQNLSIKAPPGRALTPGGARFFS